MALISGTFSALATRRFAPVMILPAGGLVFMGYEVVPFLVGYYRPTATHCIDLVPRAAGTEPVAMRASATHCIRLAPRIAGAEPVTPRAAAGLLLSPRTASARVEGP
jgi:hypothetical protein